jgi:mono/diheme cytochrome c family protein
MRAKSFDEIMKPIYTTKRNSSKCVAHCAILVLFIILSTGCDYLSLADDILPPAGSVLPTSVPTQPAQTGPLYPLIPPDPLAGESIYLESCAPCHGASGRGDGPQASNLPLSPESLASPSLYRQATPAEWYSLITKGDLERFMPPFSNLSARQRWDVVAYVYTLSKTPEETLQGMELYQTNCAECHGESGRGDGPGANSLATSPTNFTDQTFMAKSSTADFYEAITFGFGNDMPSFSDQLNEEERWALATTLRTFTYAIAGEQVETVATETEPLETEMEETQEDPEVLVQPEDTEVDSETGTVTGMVINASGGDVPSGAVVVLHGFDNMQETFTDSTVVMPDGTFTFEDVEMPEGRAYIANIEFQQTPYGSDVFVVEANTSSLDLTIHVFEATSDPSILVVDRLHIFLEYMAPDILSVTELYILSNPSSYTVVPTATGDPVITFSLPESAINLRFDDGLLGERFVETAQGFGDTAVVRPGMGAHQVLYAYDMPYDRQLDLMHPLSIPVEAVIILVQEDGLTIQSDQLFETGKRDVQGESFIIYSSNRLDAGSELAIKISGRPKTGSTFLTGGTSTSLVIGLAAFGLALIAAGIWLFRQNRGREIDEDVDLIDDDLLDEETTGADIPDDADTLMDTIIALDDLYKEGELPEEVYRQRRTILKERLRELLED